ncbi:MAG: replicative DNA helicase [Acidobacteria bacterium]|nr:replicative DNA helicase [Acidobacteriota bacterium]
MNNNIAFDQRERTLPGNPDAEGAVLGAILLENHAYNAAAEIIKADDFLSERNRIIFNHIQRLVDGAGAVDVEILKNSLTNSNELERIGGVLYLATLIEGIPRSVNVTHYARIIKDKSILRSLINASNKIIEKCYSQTEDTEAILDEAEKNIFDVAEDRIRRGFVKIGDLSDQVITLIEDMDARKGGLTGISTGFPDLDQMTAGLQKGDLIIIAARPSMGKTAFSLNMATHLAIREKKKIGYFSMEMSKEQILLRMLCSEAAIDMQRVRGGFLRQEEWIRIRDTMNLISEAPIYIDDTSSLSVVEMRAKARKLKLEAGLDILFVDYMQLMHSAVRYDSRQQEISAISRGLKGLAKELEIPVVALSQLSRAPEARAGHRPQLADLRESGAIEQDADVVSFIFREEMYRQTEENEGKAEIIIAKQRNGPTGTITLTFIKKYTRFALFTANPGG